MPGPDRPASTSQSSRHKQWQALPKFARWSLAVIAFFATLTVVTPNQDPVAQTPAKARAEQISKLFHGTDGTHPNLAIIVKAGLTNPDSFEHQQTSYRDMGEYLVISMKYQSETHHGQSIDRFTKAKVDLTGKVISILENR